MKPIAIFVITFIANSFCETNFDNLRKRLALEAITSNPNRSLVVSSLLVRLPLCKLASVTTEYSRTELVSVLGITSTNMNCFKNLKEVITPLKDLDVILLSKIIVNYTDEIDHNFIKTDADYGVKIDKVGFNYPSSAVTFINRMIERESMNRIPGLLNPLDVNNKTSTLLISAAYLKVTWEFPFDIRLTRSLKFHHHNGGITMVPMMSKTATYFYLNDDNTRCQYINIKLASFGLSMTIAVPQSSRGLEGLLKHLYAQPESLKEIYKIMRFETINLILPRFKIKTNVIWNEYLEKIGLKQIFNETESGLNSILQENIKDKSMHISLVKQASFIDVDEMGIFRQPPVKELFEGHYFQRDLSSSEMIADRPFYFVINLQRDISNLLDMHELFTGVYYGPGY